jgi:hypothetical protein
VARALFFSLLVGLGIGLLGGPVPGTNSSLGAALLASPAQPQAERVVFLAGGLTQEQLVTLSTGLVASGHRGTLLIHSSKSSPYHKLFLRSFQPQRLVPVGSFPNGGADLEDQLGTKPEATVEWKRGPPWLLWQGLFPRAERVVVCPAEPYPLLLQAACLAGVAQAPLFVTRGGAHEAKELKQLLTEWHAHTIFAVGKAEKLWHGVPGLQVIRLADEEAVAAAYRAGSFRRGRSALWSWLTPRTSRKAPASCHRWRPGLLSTDAQSCCSRTRRAITSAPWSRPPRSTGRCGAWKT